MKKRNQRRGRQRVVLVVLLLLVPLALFMGYKKMQEAQEKERIRINREIVKAMELKSVTELEGRLRELRKEYGIGKIAVEEISNKKYFEDSLFMGDSMTESIAYYEFLPKANVLATVGRNTKTALADLALLKNLAPHRIFLWYGANDLSNFSKEEFKKQYIELVAKIRQEKPDAQLVFLPILPVTDAAVAAQPELSFENMKAYNQVIGEVARETKGLLLDLKEVFSPEYYEPDGIHMKPAFYKNLLNTIKKELIERG
ncbi:hypothetical protein ABB02_01434 [Clostridiaceae bacterium JG1575]|nr:hypothetical protein ABB02_01434 [Clostridiaceae bacterium JG1575]